MLDIFLRLKTLVKISHIHIDSSVFRLHWCISSVILLTFSVIITTRQYVGNPIDCIHTNDVPDDVFDLYCWYARLSSRSQLCLLTIVLFRQPDYFFVSCIVIYYLGYTPPTQYPAHYRYMSGTRWHIRASSHPHTTSRTSVAMFHTISGWASPFFSRFD